MMKIRHILPAAMLALPLLASARPADPRPIKVVNPDGTEIEIRRVGDERFSYVTDATGEKILQNDVKLGWTPVIKDGVELIATPENIELLYQTEMQARYSRAYAPGDKQFMAALDSDGRTVFPTNSKDIHGLVVLCSFEGKDFTIENPVQAFSDLLNKKGYNEAGAIGSAADYFEKVSDGKFRPTFDIYPEVVKLPKTSAYYVGDTPTSKYDNWHEALQYIYEQIDPNLNFADYDYDNDGVVDSVYFIYAGYGMADAPFSDVIWPHQSDLTYLNIVRDGKKLGPYACSNELRGNQHVYTDAAGNITYADNVIDGIGAFCHEFGHVIGLPDLYRTDGVLAKYTPGAWSIMDQGSYNGDSMVPPLYSAYERYLCNWLDFEIAEAGKEYTLGSLDSNPRGIRINVMRDNGSVSKNEYIVLESRCKTGYDLFVPGEGLVIWHLDYNKSAWNGNTLNNRSERPRCTVVTPDGNVRNAAFPGVTGEYTFLSADFKPLLYMQSSTKNPKPTLPIYITNISYSDVSKTSKFEYNKVTEAPELDCVLSDEPYMNLGRTTVTLEWSAVPDATQYLLTVTRFDPNTQRDIVVAGFDELSVGNITKATVSVPSSAKDQEFTAYVRPFTILPAMNTSNIVKFTPSQLAGIDEIKNNASAAVFGGVGEIIAPDNAEIYTTSGVRCDKTGLAAGIYIVRVDGETVKVIVK